MAGFLHWPFSSWNPAASVPSHLFIVVMPILVLAALHQIICELSFPAQKGEEPTFKNLQPSFDLVELVARLSAEIARLWMRRVDNSSRGFCYVVVSTVCGRRLPLLCALQICRTQTLSLLCTAPWLLLPSITTSSVASDTLYSCWPPPLLRRTEPLTAQLAHNSQTSPHR